MNITSKEKNFTAIQLAECLVNIKHINNNYLIDIFNSEDNVSLNFTDIETIINYKSTSDSLDTIKLNNDVNVSFGDTFIKLNNLIITKTELKAIYEDLKKGELVDMQETTNTDNRTLDEILKNIDNELALIKIAIQNLTDKVLPASTQKDVKTIDIYDRITTDTE